MTVDHTYKNFSYLNRYNYSAMKLVFFLYFFIAAAGSSIAQVPTPVFFIKGAELEYKTMSSRPVSLRELELYEVTRITLVVTDVKDSNGVKYAYVTKTGKGIKNPLHFYQKNYVLILENNKMKIPKDLVSVDTVYLSDRYPELKKGEGYYSTVEFNNTDYAVSDLTNISTGTFQFSNGAEEIKVKSREFIVEGQGYKRQAGDQIYFGGILRPMDYTMTVSTKEVKNTGKTKLKTKAGSFDCYKLEIEAKVKIKGAGLIASLLNREVNTVVYYDPAIGIIKSEDNSGKSQTGWVELVRIKR
jgi:hypothetical protein